MQNQTIQLENGGVVHHYNNFISLYENCYTDENCDEFIDFFYRGKQLNQTHYREDYDINHQRLKNDESLSWNDYTHESYKHGSPQRRTGNEPEQISKQEELTFNNSVGGFISYTMSEVYSSYTQHWFPELTDMLMIYEGKIQKTRPGEGYHMWHSESIGRQSTCRELAWMLYLNDVEEGGETEFLYQKVRFKPKKGDFLIWPAGFTHVHRGNPPLSNDKYIATGWIEYK